MKNIIKKLSNITLEISFYVFLFGISSILPLIFHNKYYDLMECKAYFYILFSLLIIVLLFIYIFSSLYLKSFSLKNPLLICILIFSLLSIISTILSYLPNHSFIGDKGWYVGSYTILSLAISIVCLTKYRLKNNILLIPIIISISLVLIFGIFDAFELDVLGFRDGNYTMNYHSCVSLIGNVDWYAGYLSLISPLFCGLYLVENNKKKKLIFFFLSLLAIANVAFLKSDSIYLALVFLSFFIIPFIFDNQERIKRFSYLLFVYSICLIISRSLNFPMDGYCIYTRKLYVILPILILSIFLYFFSTTKNRKYSKHKKKLIISIEILLFITCVTLFVLMVSNNTDWSNGRIVIWKRSFEAFKNFSIKNKLFGVGPELLYNVYSSLFDELGFVLCSHSEPIQVLLSMGILGLISYFSCWIFIFVDYFKNKESRITPLYFGLICYFAQSFVNSATTLNLVTLSLIIILTYILKFETK